MPIAYRSSSNSGSGDAYLDSCTVPVPSGAAAGDIALLAIEMWESTNPTVTWPSGFSEVPINAIAGNKKLKVAWKRLTGADTGNYVATWTGQQWNLGHALLITGGISSGDPIEAFDWASASNSVTPTTTVTVATQAFLSHFVGNETLATTQTNPPTFFTPIQSGNVLKTNYRIPGSTGEFSATSGTLSDSVPQLAVLVAVKPEATAITGTGAMSAPPMILSGSGASLIDGTGALTAPVARIAGTSGAWLPIEGIGTLQAGAAQVDGSIEVANPTYRVDCPVVLEAPAFYGEDTPWFMKAMKWPRPISLIKRNGVFVEQRFPSQDELIPLTEGVDYFLGGYEYKGISEEVANLLISSGFADSVTPEEA